jgi:type IV pilus assembly protein PilP
VQNPSSTHGPRAVALITLVLALGACGDPISVGPPPAPPAAPTAPTAPPPPEPEDAPEEGPSAVLALSYRDEDFVEAETNRDPFRAYTSIFTPGPVRTTLQRDVIMPRTAVDEMRLIAIVSGVANPSAMLIDRDGTGHTLHRGDYVGRAEIVQTGGSESVAVTLNWRVDRIRPGEVVLTRDDPTAPNRPPLTRVITLHDPSETPVGTGEGG